MSYTDNKLIFQNINTNINKSNFSGSLELYDFNDNNSLNYKGNIKSTNFYFSDFFNATNSVSYQLILDFEGNQNSISLSDLEITSSSSSFYAFVKLDLDTNEMNGISIDINKLKSSSTDLRKTYPGIFGDILPSSISDLGIFELSGYFLETSKNGVMITAPGGVSMLKEGAPDLPVFTTSIQIPNLAKMQLEVISSEYIDVRVESVIPSRGNITRDININLVPFKKGLTYDKNSFYPENIAFLNADSTLF